LAHLEKRATPNRKEESHPQGASSPAQSVNSLGADYRRVIKKRYQKTAAFVGQRIVVFPK
jgi:hypothetical protein